MKKGCLILLMACFMTACGVIAQPTPTAVPTATATETSTPEPTRTVIPSPTLAPTSTLTPLPSVAFYAVEPTIAATASTCGDGFPDEICVSALTIALTGRQLDQYEVYVTFEGFSGTSFECPQKALLVSFGGNMAPVICNNREVTFISVGLTELTVTLTWGTGSITQIIRPTFGVVAPQGANCEPQCLVGTAEIHIP